jgi:DNA polymerase III subunit epsilon
MRWLRRWLRGPELDAAQRAAVKAYQALDRPHAGASLDATRFVVADVETSGLNPHRARLISIGAVTVERCRIGLGSSFDVILRQERPSDNDNILIHEIGGAAQLAGCEPRQALIAFLAYVGKAPLVAFHAQFDRVMIDRAMRAHLGISLANPWLDLAALAPALLPGGASRESALDDWLKAYAIENYARHDAVADSLATAELFLVALAAARNSGQDSLGHLMAIEEEERWLGRR